MGAQQVYAVFLENKHHELLVRSSPFRVHPRAPAQSAYFETGPDGQSALLQHLVITFADQLTRVLPSVQREQQRLINDLSEKVVRKDEAQVEILRLREKLASKEHERTIEKQKLDQSD